jgi:hypothetical protein
MFILLIDVDDDTRSVVFNDLSLHDRNSFLHCKHMYFIFVKVSNADPKVDLFIHAPIFSFNEVKLIIEGDLLRQSTS